MTTHTRRRILRTTAIVGALGVAGCSSSEPTETSGSGGDSNGNGGGNGGGDSTDGGSSWAQTSTVDMTDELTFEPKQIEVSAGTTVTWENVGSIGHTVTAYDDGIPDGAAYFASGEYEDEATAKDAYSSEQGGNIPEGETYEHTFETKGTYEYYCIPHELSGMVGSVRVV